MSSKVVNLEKRKADKIWKIGGEIVKLRKTLKKRLNLKNVADMC